MNAHAHCMHTRPATHAPSLRGGAGDETAYTDRSVGVDHCHVRDPYRVATQVLNTCN